MTENDSSKAREGDWSGQNVEAYHSTFGNEADDGNVHCRKWQKVALGGVTFYNG